MWRRLKNLWRLSDIGDQFWISQPPQSGVSYVPATGKQKQAEIIKLNRVDVIDEINNG